MDAGLLARSPLARLRLPPGSNAGRRSGGRLPASGSLLRARRGLRSAIAADRRLRIAILVAALAVPTLGGGWMWLRQSSLVAVEHVRISGVHGPQARAIEMALRESAMGMSTMRANPARLRATVARFPVVQDVRVSTGFPHSMRISVIEQQPVATLLVAGLKTAVAADGVVLGPELMSSSLPMLAGSYAPARGERLHNATLLESLSLLGAAPPLLAKFVERVYQGPRGLTAAMKNGLLVYFGDGSRPHAKWLSLARVLADKNSAGALYVDVRLPGRPAAGMSSESTTTSSSSEAKGGSESTVAALAEDLTGGKAEEATSEAESGSASESGTESTSEGSSEATSEPSSEVQAGTPESGG